MLLGYTLGDDGWDRAFVDGLGEALAAFDLPLLGGDTVAMPAGAPRVLGLTAIGRRRPGRAVARRRAAGRRALGHRHDRRRRRGAARRARASSSGPAALLDAIAARGRGSRKGSGSRRWSTR